ncbi:MAG: histidine phosphatase family protein [Acaryochloris sp. RU_4_1]|nr:histidine phosphatase family protein [Acaryochloris sp. RU_4_1]NJN38707.1 histidine phosphatase family protein [Acaryochloridaceae cyanobacterium CSU_3_4]NJR54179.1 histidine phosphatase family protein [Acaryochloris sp. CRU_2_0]
MSWKFETLSAHETRVILVRHGQSTFNEQERHQGSSDESVLTELGKATARQTGQFLSGVVIDALYVSSLKRAQETASEMLSMMTPTVNLQDVHVVWQLREIDLPAWQGRFHKEVQTEFAEDYRCWKQYPHRFTMADPQTKQRTYPVRDLYGRSQQFWQDILPRHFGQTLLVVSHSGTNRALINTALHLEPAYYHSLKQSNCGISVLKFFQGNTLSAQLESLNWTGHLNEKWMASKV